MAFVWDDRLPAYNFGPNHPLSPLRVLLTMRLIDEFGLLDHGHVDTVGDIEPASDDVLLKVHTPELLAAVRAAGENPSVPVDPKFGIAPGDTPAFPDMHNASARVVGATIAAAAAVVEGRAQHGINLTGGLHHAMPERVAGFCTYNDLAVAIAWLLDQGLERVAYIDVDVHHGDGVQAAFWNDPRVLTISIHESPRTLFPGTGYPEEVGGPDALGSSVNIALPAGTGDQGWLRAFHAVVPQVLEEFSPQLIVSQHGCDSHFEDPLANLTLSIDGQRMAAQAVHRWAHRYCQGRWVATGGGGYEWVDVVPRAWTHLVGIAIDRPIKPRTDIPEAFREYAVHLLGRPGPLQMTDGFDPWPKNWEMGYDPADKVDRAVLATRNAVYPHLGLPVDSWSGI